MSGAAARPPVRWRSRKPTEAPASGEGRALPAEQALRVGQLWSAVNTPTPLGLEAMERVQARLRREGAAALTGDGGGRGLAGLRRPVMAAAAATAATALLVVAATQALRRTASEPAPAGAASASPAPVPVAGRQEARAAAVQPPLPDPARAQPAVGSPIPRTDEVPAIAPRRPPRPAHLDARIARAPSPVVSPAPGVTADTGPTDAASEYFLLGEALRLLRRDHDASGALARLDEHTARYPEGQLAMEVRAARIEALAFLGRGSEALTLLDEHARSAAPDRALGVLRAELLVEAGRYREALAEAGPWSAGEDALADRATWCAAVSLARLDRTAAARATLERYLRRFPAGLFAAEARAALGR